MEPQGSLPCSQETSTVHLGQKVGLQGWPTLQVSLCFLGEFENSSSHNGPIGQVILRRCVLARFKNKSDGKQSSF
jgi:hypothetical protein